MTSRRPQEVVLTLFGEFLLHRSGPVWVGSLIGLLEPLGLSAGNVRTVLSRMVARSWLDSVRGRRGFYELSGRGRRLLEEGEARIYRPARSDVWDGDWTLVAFSIPEEERKRRDRLRVRLSWLGFGSLGKGLWISPHALTDRVRELADELGVLDRVEVFRGRHTGFSDQDGLVERCWELRALNKRYEAFISRHLPEYLALADGRMPEPQPRDAYVRRFDLVHEYREFPLLDPFLPRPLHAPDWAGECALALFQAYHDRLAGPADRFVDKIMEAQQASTP